MRRKDREVTDRLEILHLINQCDTIRLGMSDQEGIYIVPLSFGYRYDEDTLTFYFHSAAEGRKVSILSKNPIADFEMDTAHVFREKQIGCACTMEYGCVMGKGKVLLLEKTEEKLAALTQLVAHYTDQQLPLQAAAVAKTNVYRLEVKWEDISCKKNDRGIPG